MTALLAGVGRTRGFFFLSNHPWVLVALLVLVVAAVLYLQHRNRR